MTVSQSPAIRASVIVVTYNHRVVVAGCLEALVATIGPRDEVIVVDNASGDGTANLVATDFPSVRLVGSQENLGYAAGNNLGATTARGEYLVFLNPDTLARAGWLDALLSALDSHPRIGLATAKLLLMANPDRIDAFGNDVHISGIPTCRGWGRPASEYSQTEEVGAVSGACFAIRASLFRSLGGFDDRLFLYLEDHDISLRARLAGYGCVGVPNAIVLHDHRPGFTPAKLRYIERNRWWTLLKIYRCSTLLRLVPVLLLAEVVAWAMALRSGPGHVWGKTMANVELLFWLPDLAAARRLAQAHRVVSDGELLRLHPSRLRFDQALSGPIAGLGESFMAALFASGRAVTSRWSRDEVGRESACVAPKHDP